MNAAEIKTRIADLEKATKDNLPAETFLEILNSLQKEVKITEKLLRETRVGIAVNKLRTHQNKTVSELAKDIVNRWKSEVKTTAKPKSAGTITNGSTSDAQKKAPSPTIASKNSSAQSQDMRKRVRTKESDGVSWKGLGDTVRDNCVGMIYDGLCFESDADCKQILDRARAVERAVFSVSNRTDNTYKAKIRSLYLNLKDKKNPNLRRRVITGEISPERISTMTSQEMASEERRAEDQRLEEENMREAMKPTAVRSTTDQFPCGKCGKRKVAYSQAQTRSADEPMTTFCECVICGHRWKFS
ncbi:transcription factor S-II, central domain-containing protein [Kalaharituber pfeilii]|nr:transcription factor S-II, central domain-containing protein [Kalaharituber pfeilii]